MRGQHEGIVTAATARAGGYWIGAPALVPQIDIIQSDSDGNTLEFQPATV